MPVHVKNQPLAPEVVFERMKLDGEPPAAAEAMDSLKVPDTMLQDFRPVTECLEWELAELYWSREGVGPFIQSEIPYFGINSGLLSQRAAHVLFASCGEIAGDGPIAVLELGAGTGLFARFVLDIFRALCEKEGRDYYSRLHYFVTDFSARTVSHWVEQRLFEDHPAAIPATCDAMKPDVVHTARGPVAMGGLRAVFTNYLLDTLPATVLQKGADGAEELFVRTHIDADPELLKQYTSMSREEVLALARSGDADKVAQLIPLLSLLDPEPSFFPARFPPPVAAFLLEGAPGRGKTLVNHGAYACIQALRSLMDPAGFILVNDFGAVTDDEIGRKSATQVYGKVCAMGLNFPLLERQARAMGYRVELPEQDMDRGLHARLLAVGESPATTAAFREQFGPENFEFYQKPSEEGRRLALAGQKEEALENFRTALSRTTHDWVTMAEAGELVALQVRDLAAGRALVLNAVRLNPWYAPNLWNLLGDILLLERNVGAAHEAYMQASRLRPRDAQSHYNLAFTLQEQGRYEEALESVAICLAYDKNGALRARCLDKQAEILVLLSRRTLGEKERFARRNGRLLEASS